MKLKYIEKIVREVDYNDLDDFINIVYHKSPRTFEVVADQEWGNDEDHEIQIKKEEIKHDWDKDKLVQWNITGRGNYLLRLLLTDLCNRDLLEPGTYLIKVSW